MPSANWISRSSLNELDNCLIIYINNGFTSIARNGRSLSDVVLEIVVVARKLYRHALISGTTFLHPGQSKYARDTIGLYFTHRHDPCQLSLESMSLYASSFQRTKRPLSIPRARRTPQTSSQVFCSVFPRIGGTHEPLFKHSIRSFANRSLMAPLVAFFSGNMR